MSDPYAPMRSGYTRDTLTAAEVAVEAAGVTPLIEAVRDLIDAAIRSEVEPTELERARAEIEAATARLRERQLPGPFGVRLGDEHARSWGNPVVGVRNAMAVPLKVTKEAPGSVWAEADLGARFEGPPGLVHGGISALLLDQMVGEAAASAGTPGMTGQLTLRYRRPTPLGRLRFEAHVERGEGIKTLVRGVVLAPDAATGELVACVEAEAVMILPKWARAQIEATGTTAIGGDALAEPGRPTIPSTSGEHA
ncbi:PaaI family thioesterase [Nocardioides sp.]|uniref:PaaI family thioesterase n=1 Tax=Nocardioides sp. TaxID=35761 RepID=UPI00261208AC|nr:PaaI family thioesterase [Nocardioides sp.]